MKFDTYLDRVDQVRLSGAGRAMGLCPAHKDSKPSLSITEADDGKILLCCYAGCSLDEILAAQNLCVKDLFPDDAGNGHHGNGEIVAAYDYHDEAGALLFQVVRTRDKRFWQRRPDGRGGWINGLGDTPRVIYELPAVIKAVNAGERIWFVEGEKDAQTLEKLGHVATCNPMGAGKWRDSYSTVFKGADVVVVADRDEPGRKHAAQVASSLKTIAASVEILEPADGKDITDHVAAGKGVQDLLKPAEPPPPGPSRDASQLSDLLVEDILSTNPELSPEDLEGVDSVKDLMKLLGTKTTVATEIVKLIKESGATVFHDEEGNPFASFDNNGHTETWPVRSRSFKLFARRAYFQAKESAPSEQALTDALGLLEAEAVFDRPMLPVYLRVTRDAGTIYVDLGDEQWRPVAITRDGWRLLDHHPVRFRRTRAMTALPVPETGGGLNQLRRFVNVKDENLWRLVVGFLLAAARTDAPAPSSCCTASRDPRRAPQRGSCVN